MESKARIALYIILTQGIGGAERRLMRVYNRIGNSRPIDLIVRGVERDDLEKICEKADIDLSGFYSIKTFGMKPRSYIECLMYLRKQKYDVIHFFDFSFSYILLSLIKSRNTKLICTIANYFFLFKDNYVKMKMLLPRVDHVDCFYIDGKDYIMSIVGKDKVSITPGTYTDLDIFYPIEKEKTILFTAARLTVGKNAILLVKGAGLCQDDLRKEGYRIIVLGQGYEENKIKDKIAELGIEDIIDMVGYAKTSDYLRSAGILASLQKEGNYPSQSLAEGVAAGCFIIATDIGHTREGVEESFSVLIEDNPVDMAEAIKKCIRMSVEEKEKAVKAARQFAVKKYNIDVSVKYFENLINGMIEN